MLCYLSYLCHCLNGFFFFQAEDGIRDLTVTGVQTCALPIYAPEQVREGGEVTRPIRLEMIQRLERLAQRRKVTGLACIDAKPGAQRLQRHASQIMASSARWTGVAGRQRALRSCPRGASGSARREIGLRSYPSARGWWPFEARRLTARSGRRRDEQGNRSDSSPRVRSARSVTYRIKVAGACRDCRRSNEALLAAGAEEPSGGRFPATRSRPPAAHRMALLLSRAGRAGGSGANRR